jgi:hypothetical protein
MAAQHDSTLVNHYLLLGFGSLFGGSLIREIDNGPS